MERSGGLETVVHFVGALTKIQGIVGDPKGNVYVSIQSDLDAGEGAILRLRKQR